MFGYGKCRRNQAIAITHLNSSFRTSGKFSMIIVAGLVGRDKRKAHATLFDVTLFYITQFHVIKDYRKAI